MALEGFVVKYNVENSEKLKKILTILKPTFAEVKKISQVMLKLNPNNLDKAKEIECQVTGHNMILQEYYSIVASLKKNKEVAYYQMLKNRAEESNIKFVDGSSSKEASFAVADERKVRDTIDGYLKSSEQCLRTCRNLINEKQYASQSSSSVGVTEGELL